MYFKEIDVAGFKSFADRLQIKFDSGVTAIVGPNGCGKSNVADAIRWVLGEQSSKLLRGSSMQDVIFNGTEKRKSLSYAEVTLVFNNSDRYFNFDYDELAITRKLYRSGESEYLRNKIPCRLKDIIDLLHDSGIGRDGYSIIGQGKVEEIISSKPENRRAIFEEAAGIAKYKSKKVESERKLERVRDNLTRLRDILGELERQVEPLKKQSENAKKYLEFRNILKDLETNIYIFQYDNANQVKDKINLKLCGIVEELSNRTNELSQTNEKYSKNMDSVNNIDKLIEELHAEVLNLTVELEKQSGEVKVIKERINLITEQNTRISFDINNSKNNIIKIKAEKEFKENQLSEDEKTIDDINVEAKKSADRYLSIIDELTLSEDEKENSQKEMFVAMDKLTDIKSNSSRLMAEKIACEENLKIYDDKILILNQKLAIQKDSQIASKDATEKAKQQKQNFERLCADKEFEIDVLSKTNLDLTNEKHSLSSKIQVYENRRRLLQEMQAEFEGYAGSVKKLLKESEKNSAIKNKMVGVLASLIKVPQDLETAIEMALGNAVQNIVTTDEDNAKELINFLKENQFGRATFMPISSMRVRNLNFEDRKYINFDGCLGVANELISYDKTIEKVVSNLLGATVIVNNLDTAILLAKKSGFSFKIVTLDGDIVNPQGSLTGGSKKSEVANLISRDREIAMLGEEVEKFKALIFSNENLIKKNVLKLDGMNAELATFLKMKNESDIWFAKETEKLDNIEFALFSINEELDGINLEKTSAKEKIEFINAEINSISNLENDEKKNRKFVNETIESRQIKFVELRKERDLLVEKITDLKVKLSSLKSSNDSIKNDLERLSFEMEDENMNISELNKELEKNENTIASANEIIKVQIETTSSSEVRERLSKVKDRQANLDENKNNLQQEIKDLDLKKAEIMKEISRLSDRKYAEEMNLAKVDTDIESMQERIYEEYNLTYNTCLEFKRADFDLTAGSVELNKVKKEISRLGYVNVNAIEEFKNVNERYVELKNQMEDLELSESDLTKIIKELSVEMISRFETEFNKININFKQTFKELFGGGNASLVLTDSDNMLECGVDIIAEPPGKKLQSITLMSGGEKALTAIAILFAILKLKPMPFCLLDEIEAALDDANVDRFAQYLRRFSKETQFIVITHRKPTMELADSLYGVTMEEKGVSKIVSVKLSDAVKVVEVV
ncbi:MAG: chromosome segregation protein SMC [Clostridia bacterium]